jgi:hypothetical protein
VFIFIAGEISDKWFCYNWDSISLLNLLNV